MLFARIGRACLSIPLSRTRLSAPAPTAVQWVIQPVGRLATTPPHAPSAGAINRIARLTIDRLSINVVHHTDLDKSPSSHRPIDRHNFTSINPDSAAKLRPFVHHGGTLGKLCTPLVGPFDRIGQLMR